MTVKIENTAGEISERIVLVKTSFAWMKRKEAKVIDINMHKTATFTRN